MGEKNYDEHHDTIKEMLKTLSEDETDTHLLQDLADIIREIAFLRERIENIKIEILNTANRDELIHLQYDCEDAENFLKNLMKKLEVADARYMYFRIYLRKHSYR